MTKLIRPKLPALPISRRGFLAGATATGALAASGARLRAQPKRGGAVRIGLRHGSTTDSLDPGTYENGFSTCLAFTLNNYLTEIKADGSLEGEIAESWEASADASTWTFRIRDGLEFHNGKTVTAEDVIASLNHHRGEESQSAAKPIVASITDMKADGDNLLVVTLDGGNADFPFILSDYHLPIHPSADGKPDWMSGVGCGPYKLDTYDPGVRADFTRNENYWKSDRAWFDEVHILSLVDPAARTNALVTGEVEVIDGVDVKTVNLLRARPGVVVEQTTGYLHYTFPMRQDIAPFDNNHARLALKHALDREELVEKVLGGFGSVGNDHPISVANRFHNAELEQHSYDPDKAKWHVEQSGLGTLKVDLSVAETAYGGAVDAGVLFVERAKAAGIEINLVREPNDGYWSNVWNKKPFCACYWGGRPVEDQMFSTAYQCGAEWNDTVQCIEKFDKLLIEARAELDEGKRRELYGEMQKIVHDEGGVIVPMFADYVTGRSDKVAHEEQMAGNWALDGYRAAERWWFA